MIAHANLTRFEQTHTQFGPWKDRFSLDIHLTTLVHVDTPLWHPTPQEGIFGSLAANVSSPPTPLQLFKQNDSILRYDDKGNIRPKHFFKAQTLNSYDIDFTGFFMSNFWWFQTSQTHCHHLLISNDCHFPRLIPMTRICPKDRTLVLCRSW